MISKALTVILSLTVLCRLPTLAQDRWKRAATVSLAGLAAALIFGTPGVVTAVGRVTGHPRLAVLAEFLAVIIACAAVIDWVAALARPGTWHRSGPRDLITAAVLVTMAALFTVMPPQPHPATDDLVTTAGPGPAGAFLMLFFTYLTTAMTITALMCWRVTRTTPPGTTRAALRGTTRVATPGPGRSRPGTAPSVRSRPVPALLTVRIGTGLLTAGLALAACYGVNRIVYVTGRITGHLAGPGGSFLISTGVALEYVAIAIILAGIAVPTLGTAWQAACDLRSLHALRPLHQSLTAAVPSVSEGLPRPSPAATLWSPRAALIRTTAEIRDAALHLRYAIPRQTIAQARTELAARGLTGPTLTTANEACWLLLAARTPNAQLPPNGPPPGTPVPHILPGADTLDAEVALLRRLAAATRSAAVHDVTVNLANRRGQRTRSR